MKLLRLLPLALMIAATLVACSGKPALTPTTEALTTGEQDAADPGTAQIPGEATLAGGARIISDGDADAPLPNRPAIAGVDFASDRFVVIFDNNPQPTATAPYLSNAGNADRVLSTDNAPLVQHPYFRKISHNLAAKYGVSEVSRVFYKDVNFAVYEMPVVHDVSELDAMMLKVLHENPGLVREVVYDMYTQLDDFHVTDLPKDEAFQRAMRRNPIGLQAAEQGSPKGASITPPNDPYYKNRPGTSDPSTGQGTWGLWRMGATHDTAWTYTTGSNDVMVAVVDTGCRISHEDLSDNCIDAANTPPFNAPGIYTDVYYKDNVPNDGHGHGTFCCGEIGAKGNNGVGLAGVCWTVKILPIKVLSNGGGGTQSQCAEGMLLADYLGANIISMSLGWPFPARLQQLAARQCDADGMLICCSAGNENNSGPHYASAYPECFSVGATTLVNASDNEDYSLVGGELPLDSRYDARTYFSCYGDTVDIAAPGYVTLSTSNTSDTSYAFGWAGTSMSTPYVAGVAALIWSYIDNPTATKVRALIQSSATEMTHLYNGADPKGFIDDTTNGTVHFCNAYAALQLYAGGPYTAPTVSWNNPTEGSTISGTTELRLDVTAGSGTIQKVEFETPNRLIAVKTAPESGYYRANWESAFEFNGPLQLKAKVYDDKGSIVTVPLNVVLANSHVVPPYSEDFTGVANDAIPTSWFAFDGNTGTNTSWGATDSIGGTAPPCMHSSGTTADYVESSNDWLYAPVIDLRGFASATLTFKRRYERSSGDYMYFITTDNDRDYNYDIWYSNGLHDWSTVNYDLSAYAGEEVRLLWLLDADASYTSVAGGLWIDDVSISVASGTAPTISIDSPSNGSSVSGVVQVDVTVSDDTEALEVKAIPPVLGSVWYTSIPDNDPGPNKHFTFYWDSRHTYNGGVLLTVLAYDDENGDGSLNDFIARADVSLSVDNTPKSPNWYEGFESIGTLGGISGGAFDGDWYTWTFGNSYWHINTLEAHTGDKSAKMGPDDSGNYGSNELDQLYSPVFDLSSATRPHLRIWHQLDVADDNNDFGRLVMVRYDGLDDIETTLAEYRSDTSPAGSWVSQAFDLTPYKSDPLRFNFIFYSNGDSNTGKGWLLDDIEVLDANPTITSISNNSRGTVGSTRTISGSNFGVLQGASTVTFAKSGGGTTEATVNSWSDTSIEVVVPSDAVTGDVVVTVLGYDSNGYNFRVVLGPPTLTDLNQL